MMTPDRDQLFDIRVVERNITRGKVTREELSLIHISEPTRPY